MQITFDNPIRVGDLITSILVDALELDSISYGRKNSQNGKALVSIVLKHSASGWSHNVIAIDDDASTLWMVLNASSNLEKDALNYCISKGKLPAGKII